MQYNSTKTTLVFLTSSLSDISLPRYANPSLPGQLAGCKKLRSWCKAFLGYHSQLIGQMLYLKGDGSCEGVFLAVATESSIKSWRFLILLSLEDVSLIECIARKWALGQRVPPLSRYFFGQYLHLHSTLLVVWLIYLVSGSSSGIWLNTQQVRGLASLACCSGSSSDDKGAGDEGVEYSEKESWEDIVASDSKERGKKGRESRKELPYIMSVLD